MLQRIGRCVDQLSAKLIVEEEEGLIATLSAFGTLLHKLAMVPKATCYARSVTQSTSSDDNYLQQERHNNWGLPVNEAAVNLNSKRLN